MFINDQEKKISKQYLEQGYVVKNVDNINSLNWIRSHFCKIIKNTK